MNCIYTVHVFKDVIDTAIGIIPFVTKNVGYYFEEADAIDCVENNYCNIRKDYFDYCCIEKISEGLYNSAFCSKKWYKWNEEENRYVGINDIGISDEYMFEVY